MQSAAPGFNVLPKRHRQFSQLAADTLADHQEIITLKRWSFQMAAHWRGALSMTSGGLYEQGISPSSQTARGRMRF
jgi:hypothetical protein